MDPKRVKSLEQFARSLGISLRRKELPLIDQSLTHKSYAFEAETGTDNERLEFLGDAVVGLVVSQAVYEEFEAYDEGRLSQAKAAVVSRKTLGRTARELGFGSIVLFGRGESKNGGAARLSTLGAALEAFVGALYVLRGFKPAAEWVRQAVLASSRKEMLHGAAEDYKSRLQEWTQAHLNSLPHYRRVSESGPDHNKSFVVEVLLGGKACGQGQGRRLKDAEHSAAQQALLQLTKRAAIPQPPDHPHKANPKAT